MITLLISLPIAGLKSWEIKNTKHYRTYEKVIHILFHLLLAYSYPIIYSVLLLYDFYQKYKENVSKSIYSSQSLVYK